MVKKTTPVTSAGTLAAIAASVAGDGDVTSIDAAKEALGIAGEVHPEWALQEDEAAFRAKYPLTVALMEGHDKGSEPALRVTAKVSGFRRGGIVHSSTPTEHRLLALSPDQVEAILSEDALVIETI